MTGGLRSWRQPIGRILVWLMLGVCGAAGAEPLDYPEIVVTAIALPTAPERSLESAEIEGYGLGTVAEVIGEVAAEHGETPEDAAFLINGKRVAGLGSVADLPAEAIVSIDVLPVGSGLQVGAGARQRVYALRLRSELDLGVARAAARVPTGGGWRSLRGEAAYTHIRAERRITLAAKLRDESTLLESERDVIQPAGAVADAGRWRSLLPASDRVDFSLSAADQPTTWLSVSLISKLSLAQRHSLLGPLATTKTVSQPLDQRSTTLSGSTDLSLDARLGRWQIGVYGGYAYRNGRILTDRQQIGVSEALVGLTRSVSASLSGRLNAFGPVMALPAGPLLLTLGAGASRDRIEGRRILEGAAVRNGTTLTSTSLSAAIDVPIASRSAGVLAMLGDLSAGAEFSRQHASDFGAFTSYTLSLLWRPAGWISLTGSVSRSDSAPPVASLDEPRVETPGSRYFDPLRGETVDVIQVTGGTLGLPRQSERTKRLAVNLKPFRSLALRLNAEYFETGSHDFMSDLPPASPAIMRAFPDRFVRDGSERLILVDSRPVFFARRAERQIRTGLILNLPLGAGTPRSRVADDDDEGLDRRAEPPRAGVRPRLQLSASHSWLLESELVVRSGLPAIDLLSREAVGFGGLGQPRHRLDASLGYAERGLGVRAGVQWRGASLIETGGGADNVLTFRPLTTFNLRAWVQGERLAPEARWMRGTRISLTVQNATGVREKVADRFGVTPLSYQPSYRDPLGRSVEIEFRKKF